MNIKDSELYITNKLLHVYDRSEAESIAVWIIENLTGVNRAERIVQSGKSLSTTEVSDLQQKLTRLLDHEPVQYVLNEAWFYGLKLFVDHHVLIPRPETEELVEWIITDCSFPIQRLSILDIGTGSGCIPLALKKRLGKADVWGCDISRDALHIADKNSKLLGIDIKLMELDFLNQGQRDALASFDILVSNPPYIPENEKNNMRPNVLNYEPATALFVPDDNALLFYSAIAGFGITHLKPGGKIYSEINETRGDETRAVFENAGYLTTMKKDMQGKDRMIKAVRQEL